MSTEMFDRVSELIDRYYFALNDEDLGEALRLLCKESPTYRSMQNELKAQMASFASKYSVLEKAKISAYDRFIFMRVRSETTIYLTSPSSNVRGSLDTHFTLAQLEEGIKVWNVFTLNYRQHSDDRV